MQRNSKNTWMTWGAFLLTFLWVFLPEDIQGPSVVWPSLVAVFLAFATRDIYVSLFTAAFAGSILLNDGNVFKGFIDLFATHLVPVLSDPWKVSVILFSFMMGGFVELLNRNGSMLSLARYFLGQGNSRRRAGLGVFGMGWLVFFDGLANCMLVGKTMRAVTDRAGISREKLAFVVDSTSSPIASFALVSTWIATEMGLILAGFQNAGVANVGPEISPFKLLIESLPFRFYNYFCLAIVFLTIWLGREYGPMLQFERQKRSSRPLPRPDVTGPDVKVMLVGLLPLLTLILGVFGGLYIEGGGLEEPWSLEGTIQVFGQARADIVFICATAFASIISLILTCFFLPESTKESPIQIYFEGMRHMFMPMMILVFAFMLSHVIQDLGTANWLVGFLGPWLPAALLPFLVFLLAAFMSFSTGTSWGTMGMLMPLAIPVAVSLTGWEQGESLSVVVIATIGSVLAGSVFGDHCSPISDTTIVSAFSSGCDPMNHVRSQMPYALFAGGLAAVLGYLPAGFGVPVWFLLPMGLIICWIWIRFKGSLVTRND
ncbi:MAG: Na+/H+ antiporter NhaC family protein [Verrucomicrobiota bacterium]|nr:Na+/H+ antiporter NhaC family protein [Verrucomicrobiota bacterium]